MGTPTEAEIQTQWRNAVDILETTRSYADGTVAPAAGLLDVLQQSLEGDYTPVDLPNAMTRFRANLSSLVDSSAALEFLTPLLYEYGKLMSAHATLGYGAGYRDRGSLFRALYEWFIANSLTVQSRGITFDTSATAGGSNVGNGAMSRLTVDEHGFAIEDVHVEKKTFRCRSDQNTGAQENAEVFEFLGTQQGQDALLLSAFGSGDGAQRFIPSHHAGSGAGGSLLTNSSFSDYLSTATPKFTAWTETAGGAQLSQSTATFYRSHPGSQTDASLVMSGGSGTVTVTQTIDLMRVSRLDPEVPYFCRVMVNKSTASGGSVTLTMGDQSTTVTVASLSAGWNEILIGPADDNWPRVFNTDPFLVSISWTSSTSGTLLFDDLLFAPWDFVDGSWWFLRGNAATHTPWLIDDTLTFTDTGGAPATGIIQWWLFVAGLGYLPSTTGTPAFADP